MNPVLLLLAIAAVVIMALGLATFQKQMARRYAVDAVRSLLADYHKEIQGVSDQALQGFQSQARAYRLHDAQRADALAGMLFRVTAVESGLATLLGTRDEANTLSFPSTDALDSYMRVKEIPTHKRTEIAFLYSMDPKRAVREVVQYRRLQDVTALRVGLGALQRAFDKARPYLPPAILSDYAALADRGRSLALNEDVQDEAAWNACLGAARAAGEAARRLPEGIRREMARPLDQGISDQGLSSTGPDAEH